MEPATEIVSFKWSFVKRDRISGAQPSKPRDIKNAVGVGGSPPVCISDLLEIIRFSGSPLDALLVGLLGMVVILPPPWPPGKCTHRSRQRRQVWQRKITTETSKAVASWSTASLNWTDANVFLFRCAVHQTLLIDYALRSRWRNAKRVQ